MEMFVEGVDMGEDLGMGLVEMGFSWVEEIA